MEQEIRGGYAVIYVWKEPASLEGDASPNDSEVSGLDIHRRKTTEGDLYVCKKLNFKCLVDTISIF